MELRNQTDKDACKRMNGMEGTLKGKALMKKIKNKNKK